MVMFIWSFKAYLQARYRRQHGISIFDAEKLALFSGISVEEMDKSIIKSVAYLMSHVFDFYGLQVSPVYTWSYSMARDSEGWSFLPKASPLNHPHNTFMACLQYW